MASPLSSTESSSKTEPLMLRPADSAEGAPDQTGHLDDVPIIPMVVAGGVAGGVSTLFIVASLIVLVAGVVLALAFPPAVIPITISFSAVAAVGLMLSLPIGALAGMYFGSKYDTA